MRSELAAIVDLYPRMEVAKKAGTHLEIVQKAIKSEEENIRRVRDYWNSVYLSRQKDSQKSK